MFVQSGELITPALILAKWHSVRNTWDRIDLFTLNLTGNKSHRFGNVKTVIQDPVLFVAVLLFVKAHYQVNMLLPHRHRPQSNSFLPPAAAATVS